MPALTQEQASGFARLALKGLGTEYPNKPEHVMAGPDDVKGPKALHPAFFGCYDWHSSVHGHWMLVRLLRVAPGIPSSAQTRYFSRRYRASASCRHTGPRVRATRGLRTRSGRCLSLNRSRLGLRSPG